MIMIALCNTETLVKSRVSVFVFLKGTGWILKIEMKENVIYYGLNRRAKAPPLKPIWQEQMIYEKEELR